MNLQEFYQENARDVAAYTAEVERVVKQATGKSLAETGWLITMAEHWAYGDSPAFAARCAISYWTSTHRTPATRRKYAELQMARGHMNRGRGMARYTARRRHHHREMLVSFWGIPAWSREGNCPRRMCLRLFYRDMYRSS